MCVCSIVSFGWGFLERSPMVLFQLDPFEAVQRQWSCLSQHVSRALGLYGQVLCLSGCFDVTGVGYAYLIIYRETCWASFRVFCLGLVPKGTGPYGRSSSTTQLRLRLGRRRRRQRPKLPPPSPSPSLSVDIEDLFVSCRTTSAGEGRKEVDSDRTTTTIRTRGSLMSNGYGNAVLNCTRV